MVWLCDKPFFPKFVFLGFWQKKYFLKFIFFLNPKKKNFVKFENLSQKKMMHESASGFQCIYDILTLIFRVVAFYFIFKSEFF
jgi:hypothetical protein